jgi:hypothetical protein
MKKIYLYITILSLIMTGLVSCGDYLDFSSLHTLTDVEKAEMARQDSIALAQKTHINANLILQYSVDITISKSSYDGTSLTLDVDKIATALGVTKEQLLAGIEGTAGAPEIKGFAIEGSTHADIGTATNTNSPWGHWWNENGDLTTWGATAMVFAEFNTELGAFNIGQYPGHLTDGQTFKIIECLKYNEKRVAILITINAKAAGKITAPIVRTQNISIDIIAKNNYDSDSVKFDLAQTLSDLGVTTLSDAKFVAVNTDGSFTAEYSGPPKGFWYDLHGFAGEYGDDASVYTDYGEFLEDKVSIGQFPGHLKGGDSFTIQYGIMANNKIEMLKITINVKAYQDPETAPAGTPKELDRTVTLTKVYSSADAVQFDVKELLRDAFKKTTYQIHQAIISGDLKLYVGAVSTTDPTYTADAPGYWLDANGAAAAWAKGFVFCSLGHSETELYLYGSNHADNAPAGTTVTTKLIATYNGGTVTFNITFKVIAS